MIYLNSNIINKIGNSNRLYYNGSIVYQGYTTGGGNDEPENPEGMVSLQYYWDNQIFDVPFIECYIDMNNVQDDASSYYFIALATKPNTQNASITSYSICPKENTIFDKIGSYSRRYGIMENFYNGSYNFMEVVAIPLGDGIYYYQFAQPVYLSNKPSEANAPYWRVNVVPINN